MVGFTTPTAPSFRQSLADFSGARLEVCEAESLSIFRPAHQTQNVPHVSVSCPVFLSDSILSSADHSGCPEISEKLEIPTGFFR